MKKLLLGMLIIVLSFSMAIGAKTQIRTTKSDETGTTLTFKIGSYELIKVETPKGASYIPTINKAAKILNAGYPAMLRISESIVIPDKGQSEITIIDAKYETIQDIDIAPSKGNIYRNVSPSDVPYTYGEIYNQNTFYPETVAELAHNYILRDYRGQALWVNPMQYNPVTKELRVYTEITVKISTNDKKGDNEITRTNPIEKVSTVYNQIYKNQFANYEQIQTKYTPLGEEGNMLVIAPTTYLETMVPFVAWKNQSGVPTEIVDLSDVGTSASQIKTYIENYYNEHGLTFVLLIGDDEHLTASSTSAGDSDAAYGFIEGNDSYAEIIIGRFSGSVTDVAMMVQKTIAYEKTPVATDAMYDRFALIASAEGGSSGDDGESDVEHMRNIKPDLTGFTYTETDSYEFFDGSHGELDATGNPNASMVVNAINNGVGVMGYIGHGSDYTIVTTGFGTSNFGSLTNTDMWPFMFDVSCVNGNFVGQTCFAEGFVRAANNGEPTGALALCASTINQWWSPPMSGQDEMYDLLVNSYTDNIKHTFGGVHVNGCMQMNDDYGTQGNEMTDTWTIFGDPSVMLRTGAPTEFSISADPVIFLGGTDYAVTCDTDGARVTLSIDGQIIASGTVNDGIANLTFEALTNPTIATLTVVGFNKMPSITSIEVIPAAGPYIKVDALILSDVQGNNNQMADFGETISLGFDIKNVGSEEATNLSISASTEDEFILINGEAFTFSNVAAETTVSITDVFELTVSETVPDQHKAMLTLTITDGNEVWTSNANITINAPKFEIAEMAIMNDNDANGRLDPGETADIVFTVNNIGHADASNVVGTLSGDSPYFTITNITKTENIGAESSASYTYAVEASLGTPQGTPVNLIFDVALGEYTDTATEEVVIGQPAEIGIGSGTEASGNYPFYTYYKSNRTQMLYLGSEIGAGEMNIQELAFDFSRIDTKIKTLTNFKINLVETTATAIGSSYADMTTATTVLESATYTMPQTTGIHVFDIDDFVFDASKNLIVEIIWGVNSAYANYGQHYTINSTSTGFTSVAYGYEDTQAPATYDGNSSIRPNLVLYTENEAPGTMYAANFTVTDGTNPIEGATVMIGSMSQTADAVGQTSFDVYAGTYYYSVYADGYGSIINETMVVDGNMDMPIAMVGIASDFLSDLKLYPNPTSTVLNIEYTMKTAGKVTATLYSIEGKMIQNIINENSIGGTQNKQINVEHLQEGVYYLNITMENMNKVQKIVITK